MDIAKCLNKSKIRFGKFIEEYLFSRKQISLIILLIDIRHTPTENDILMYNYIKNTGLPFLIVANKADKIAITKVNDCLEALKKNFQTSNDNTDIFPFSSERKIYSENIWNELEKYF